MKKWFPALVSGVTLLACWMIYRARRRRDYPLIPLAHAMRHMKTGDLVLFSGREIPLDTPSEMMRRMCFLGATYAYRALDACEWGHVAVVYRSGDKLYFIHCEMSTQHDALAGEPVTGVQVSDLQEKLARYSGYCVWRPINRAIPEQRVKDFLQLTYHFNYRIPGDVWMRFLDRILGARRARCPKDPVCYQTTTGMFCTEWVGAFYEFCGVFDRTRAPYKTYFLPSDFTYTGCERYLMPEYSFDNDGWELEV
uniref:Peptidase n=1 Tax=viral metagenome TaxID=1070528 RepID=A0A6C0BN80_9ZZZZ